MLVEFKELPDESRIWIYQCNRTLAENEVREIRDALNTFLINWTAHGTDLRAGYELPYNRFIVVGLDQSRQAATGCSIDAMVHLIQQFENNYKIDLLDKMNVSYKQGDYIAYKALNDFKKMGKQRAVSKKTIVFNNLVNNKREYLDFWEVPASESWHARFL